MKKLPKAYNELFEDLKEYKGLSKEEKEYIERFYLENYNDAISFEGAKVLKSPDMVKAARKNHNAIKRDATRVAKTTGGLRQLSSIDKPENREFMESVYRDNAWQTAFKIGGYELAGKQIVNDTIERIQDAKGDEKILSHILMDMLISFRELRKINRKDKRNKNENR